MLSQDTHLSSSFFYEQILDGGSTGSRLHIFESTADELVRRGSERANVPLSAFGRTVETQHEPLDATAVAQHLYPVFDYAARIVPTHCHATTRVLLQATAGMRLLDATEQEAVYDALYQGLVTWPQFTFQLQRSDVGTLSGDLEGFYGAVAANYLKGTIDANLNLIQNGDEVPSQQLDSHDGRPIGALDMGGSSTQMVFLPHAGSTDSDNAQTVCRLVDEDENQTHADCTEQHEVESPEELPNSLHGPDFFATSYLSYGVDQFRERLWRLWVHERQHQVHPHDSEQVCDASDNEEPQCTATWIENPCTFKGYEMDWEGYTLLGTGDAHECIRQVQRLIPHAEEPDAHSHRLGTHVGGIEHPPVRGKFFAMSLYFFALDSLRALSHPDQEAYRALNLSWPTPSIQELYNALDGLCSRSWTGDLEEIQHEAHAYTRAEVLPHRCLESVYMVTLLRDGFGFEPESRDITFTFLVDGSEVEWTLGMALVLRQQEQQERQASPKDTSPTTATEESIPVADNSNYTFEEEEYRARDMMNGLFREFTQRLLPTSVATS